MTATIPIASSRIVAIGAFILRLRESSGVYPAVNGGAASAHSHEVVRVLALAELVDGGNLRLAGFAGGSAGGVGASVVDFAGVVDDVADLRRPRFAGGSRAQFVHALLDCVVIVARCGEALLAVVAVAPFAREDFSCEFVHGLLGAGGGCRGSATGVRGRSCGLHVLGLAGVGNIGQSAVLRPVAGVVAASGVVAGGDLHLVRPLRRAFNGKPAADVDADVSFHPYGFADFNLREVCGDVLADLDHAVRADVRHSVDGVSCAAVGLAGVSVPSPEQPFDEADAVEAERVRAGRVDHRLAARLGVVGVVVDVSGFVRRRHGCAEAAHNVKGFIVLRHGDGFLGELCAGADFG